MPQPAEKTTARETEGSVIRWAWLYDALGTAMTFGQDSVVRRQTIALANVRPGERVLDIGCGTGTLAILARKQAGPEADVHGVDASPEMIAVATRKAAKEGADVRFQVGVIEKLPFPNGSFDLVLSSFMLHHLPDDLKSQGFAEIARVLKDGGRLLAADLSGRSGSALWSAVLFISRHKMPPDYRERLQRMIREAGLSPETLETPQAQHTFIRGTKTEIAN